MYISNPCFYGINLSLFSSPSGAIRKARCLCLADTLLVNILSSHLCTFFLSVAGGAGATVYKSINDTHFPIHLYLEQSFSFCYSSDAFFTIIVTVS